MADINSGKSTLELKILKFISEYGPEQLIEWLDAFDIMGGPGKHKLFRKLERIACDSFGITIADMRTLSKPVITDTRRVICFIGVNRINLKPQIISRLLGGVSVRSIGYYIKDAETWIMNPKANKSFFDGYTKTINKFTFEIEQNDKN